MRHLGLNGGSNKIGEKRLDNTSYGLFGMGMSLAKAIKHVFVKAGQSLAGLGKSANTCHTYGSL